MRLQASSRMMGIPFMRGPSGLIFRPTRLAEAVVIARSARGFPRQAASGSGVSAGQAGTGRGPALPEPICRRNQRPSLRFILLRT
jgi:hypothetical protein